MLLFRCPLVGVLRDVICDSGGGGGDDLDCAFDHTLMHVTGDVNCVLAPA